MHALPPGPRFSRPLQTLAWVARPGPFLARARERYGDTFSLKIGYEPPWVVVSDPEDVKTVFTGDPDVLHAGKGNAVLRPVLGRHSVLLLDRGEHLRQRRLLLPPFHGSRMARYEELMRETALREIATWPEDLATQPRMQALTLSIILRSVFGGVEEGALHQALRQALDAVAGPRGIALMAVLGPDRTEQLDVFGKSMARVNALIADEIARRRRDPSDDVLSLLVEARHEDGSPMSDEEIRDELMTLLIAGHETTATALAWAVERLARHPEAWARLREDGEPYADAIVKETLRLRPVLPIVIRNLAADFEVGGRVLPAGVSVVPCIWLMHRREDLYPDAKAFRPERWLGVKPGTYTWIPFGGGVRRCLGAAFAELEMRIVLQTLAGRWKALRPDRAEPERVKRRAITFTPARGGRVMAGTGGPRQA